MNDYVKQCYHCKEPNIYTGDMGYYRCSCCRKMTICIIMTKENWLKQIEEREQRWERERLQREKELRRLRTIKLSQVQSE